jgi:hypothetical protein
MSDILFHIVHEGGKDTKNLTAGTAVAEPGGAKPYRAEQTWAPVRLAKPAAAEPWLGGYEIDYDAVVEGNYFWGKMAGAVLVAPFAPIVPLESFI